MSDMTNEAMPLPSFYKRLASSYLATKRKQHYIHVLVSLFWLRAACVTFSLIYSAFMHGAARSHIYSMLQAKVPSTVLAIFLKYIIALS